MPEHNLLSFGPFRLDARNEQLWRGQEVIRLTNKALAVLRYLVEQSGQLVTKDDLFAAVWPEVVVSDSALVVCIREPRRALGDERRTSQFIETVHGRGYRFVATVTELVESPTLGERVSVSVNGDSPTPVGVSVAVLPFTNMSEDPAQEYFCDGLTDDLITDLSKIAALFVIARHSVFTYKGKAVKVQEVNKELGARYALEGSVRKTDDQVRVNAQLVDTATGYHL